METSLRYGGDSKALRIHAKENFPIATNKHFQVHAALDTGSGDLGYFSGIIRNFYPELSTTLGVGLRYDKQDKFRYTVHGKTKFPLTTNGQLSFNIKGRYDAHKDFQEKKSRGAAEFSWSIFNFQKDQDVRFKVGYEVFNKVPYLQIRENNWTLNADMKGKWYVRFDL
ncbi:outer envelope pore protein 21, chloroplastic-like isoform X2 [Macadamia integrifolia]|uniref:outer envelope pore protein 21, chloroplastic-like isoform X2 n=1 Tax=Macadamia integrifolia TaxID=60698 RepID=UPI001C4F8033|nr:outer envelope pore protein 21, chloroplastic-like isoform X2 [Macadamia integrifolia]